MTGKTRARLDGRGRGQRAAGPTPYRPRYPLQLGRKMETRSLSRVFLVYLYWKAINQGGGVMHKFHKGDIYVANTAFGTIN